MALNKDMLETTASILTSHEQKRAAALAVCRMVPREHVRYMLDMLDLYRPLKASLEQEARDMLDSEEAAAIVRDAGSAVLTGRARAFPRGSTRY